MLPEDGRQPVFALAPAEGDVDILIAAEMMEAGRAIMRGFVTPNRTTLIASSHRALAVSEKIVPGSGLADAAEVRKAAETQAMDFVAFDMESIAQEAGSVISASLFGALAGSGALPFPAESYRETIRASGRGVEASLRAFEAAREAAEARRVETEPAPEPARPAERAVGPKPLLKEWQALEARVVALPEPAQAMAAAGLRKVVDYQDLAYGGEYLSELERLAQADAQAGGEAHGFAFTENAAKYLAAAMAYDDILRVADLKTRAGRFDRIDAEMGAREGTLVQVTEYVHPGAAEFVSLMPARLGAWVEGRPKLFGALDWAVNRGRRMRTDRVLPFLTLWALGGARRWRRRLLRHGREVAHRQAWLSAAEGRLRTDYALAVETLKARRLIKGYSDTHARGMAKFDKVMSGIALVEGREDAADWARRLIAAALQDPKGEALDGALKTIRSFAAGGRA
jgi:indolepyruvate ferredoxin oxidoreductase beta subunit